MRRGQLEGMFQWIFVLIAGSALLLLLLFGARSCSQAGEARLEGIGVQNSAARISSLAWQGGTKANLSVQPAQVTCRQGALMLESERAQAGLEKIPAFLSPEISGTLFVRTEELRLAERNSAPISIGTLLLGTSENVWYYLVDANVELPEGTRTMRIPVSDLPRLPAQPATARRVVVLTRAIDPRNLDASSITVPAQAVQLLEGRARFFALDTGFSPIAEHPTGSAAFESAAAIAGNAEPYACARRNVEERAMTIVQLSLMRIDDLDRAACAGALGQARTLLAGIDSLESLYLQERAIAQAQARLLGGSCPVIA